MQPAQAHADARSLALAVGSALVPIVELVAAFALVLPCALVLRPAGLLGPVHAELHFADREGLGVVRAVSLGARRLRITHRDSFRLRGRAWPLFCVAVFWS